MSKTGIRKNSRASKCLVGIRTILFYLFYLGIYIYYFYIKTQAPGQKKTKDENNNNNQKPATRRSCIGVDIAERQDKYRRRGVLMPFS